jgi:ABC-type antimicrobial peptide transport system permease subunit
VISYLVTQRTHEIGVRMAIGAQRARIIALVLREGMTLALLGGMVGLAAAVLLSRFLESILYEVDPREPLTLVGVYLLLLTVAAIACLVPARRAATVDPAIALRHD